ncbi:glycosyltransferase family 2 protein, partial [Myriangium duriaei CBS 260.36]
MDLSDGDYSDPPEPVDQAHVLTPRELSFQRYGFFASVLIVNTLSILLAYLQHQGTAIFTVILFIKSRDILSVVITVVGMIARSVDRFFNPVPPITSQFILTLIPAYSESQEQILKAIHALRNNGVEPHHQVMLVILDGKPVDIKSSMTKVCKELERPHDTFKGKRISLGITAGFIGDVPVLVIQKRRNSGKKDTLIMTNDIFNYPRDNMPVLTRRLRREIWLDVLPELTAGFPVPFTKFDMIFNTDADSKIHQGALLRLANSLVREPRAIASCGLVLVEFEEGCEWSAWNMYQQFQYCYGQYVRRGAEHIWGKVTCLPGCITMIKVMPECGPAMKKYAAAITGRNAIAHQVQYLGTDRRQTYCFLSQSRDLKTLFIPNAVSETVAPQSLTHYLSQRRRWGSNAYFNNYFYCFGENMALITRTVAFLELVRLTMVYWRFSNTIQFVTTLIRQLAGGTFAPITLAPLISIGQLPLFWFIFCVIKERPLRERMHKLALGWMINKTVAPFMSMAVFTKVAMNIGSQVWGLTGTS